MGSSVYVVVQILESEGTSLSCMVWKFAVVALWESRVRCGKFAAGILMEVVDALWVTCQRRRERDLLSYLQIGRAHV